MKKNVNYNIYMNDYLLDKYGSVFDIYLHSLIKSEDDEEEAKYDYEKLGSDKAYLRRYRDMLRQSKVMADIATVLINRGKLDALMRKTDELLHKIYLKGDKT